MKMTKIFVVIIALLTSLCILATGTFAQMSDFELYGTEPSAIYEKSADGTTIYIECKNVEEYPIAIVLALYKQGKLVDIMDSYGESSVATFVTDCEYDSEKVMIWNSLKGMKPVVASENIISSQKPLGKIEGVVIETSHNGSLKKNEISYRFHRNRVYGDKSWTAFINQYFEDNDEEVTHATADFTLADHITDITDYLQRSSSITLKEVSTGRFEVVDISLAEADSIVEIGLEDIDDTEVGAGKYDTIEYYPSSASTKTSKYKLDKGADYYYNYGVIYGDEYDTGFELFQAIITDEEGNILSNTDMEITLVENDGDSYFDAVMMKQYIYDIVKAIDEDVNVIEGVNDNLTVEMDDEEVLVSMKNADGEEITLDDFSQGDVIAYISEGGKRKNYDWIEIINLGENSVTGIVNKIDAQNGVIYVNSTEYGLAGVEPPSLGDEGAFYLTKKGKVFFIDTAASVSGNYAYVLNAAYSDAGFTAAWQLKLLTKDNEVVIYTVRDIVDIDGYEVNAKAEDCDDLEAFEAQWDWDGNDFDKGAHRVITYKLDSKNQIREINTVWATRFTDKEYNKDAQVLAVDLVDNAVIFNIDAGKSEHYFATDISYLKDGAEYSGYYITNYNEDNDCVVITEGGTYIDYTQDIAIIASVTDIKLDEGTMDAKEVRYYASEEDELKSLTIVDEDDVSRPVESSYADLKAGSLIMFTADETGMVSAYIVIAELNYDDEYVLNEDAIEEICDKDDGNAFVIGTIDDIKTVSAGKKVETTAVKYTKEGTDAPAFLTIKGSANAYTYQNRNGKTIIHVGDWRANNVEAGEGYIYIARVFNGTTKDIITNSMSGNQVVIPEENVKDMGYAYVIDATYSDTDIAEAWQLKLLTKYNEIVTYDVYREVNFDGDEISTEYADCYPLAAFATYEDMYGNDLDKGIHRVITYGVDSRNRIIEINKVSAYGFEDEEYIKSSQMLGKNISEDTIIFDISSDNSDYYFAGDISYLEDGRLYGGFRVTNSDGKTDCVVITSPKAAVEDIPVDITYMGYAYVLNAAYNDSDFTAAWQLKLLTKDNEVVIYTVRDKVEVDGAEVNAKLADCDALEAFEASVDADGYDLDKGVHRIITFKLDSKNKIRSIQTVGGGEKPFTATSLGVNGKEYNADAQVLGADIADKAVIFNIDAGKSEYYFATDISYLKDGAEYKGWYITNYNEDNDCVVITEGGTYIDYTQDIAIIASVMDIKLNEGTMDAKEVRYYASEEDELKSLTIVDEDDVSRPVESSYADIKAGSLFMFTADEAGMVSAYIVIAELNYDDEYVLNEDAIAEICDKDDDNAFVIGTIDDIKTVSAGKKVETTAVKYTKEGTEDPAFLTIKGSANAYTYQNRNGKTVIHVGDWRANNVEAGEGYIYIARLINNTVNDIVVNSMVTGQIEFPEEYEIDSDASSYVDYTQNMGIVSSVSDLDIYGSDEDAKKVGYYLDDNDIIYPEYSFEGNILP